MNRFKVNPLPVQRRMNLYITTAWESYWKSLENNGYPAAPTWRKHRYAVKGLTRNLWREGFHYDKENKIITITGIPLNIMDSISGFELIDEPPKNSYRSLENYKWYADWYCEFEVYSAAVVSWATSKGRLLIPAVIREGEDTMKLYLKDSFIHQHDKSYNDEYSGSDHYNESILEAYRDAIHITEREAEEAREYDLKYNILEQYLERKDEELSELREEIRYLCSALKKDYKEEGLCILRCKLSARQRSIEDKEEAIEDPHSKLSNY